MFEQPDDAIDKMLGNEKFKELRSVAARATHTNVGAPTIARPSSLSHLEATSTALLTSPCARLRRSKLDYKNLKEWMDSSHKGWEKNCGLVQVKDEATGRFEWQPPVRVDVD